MRRYSIDKEDYLIRLRKIEGQVRGLQRMIDDDTYCVGIVTQVGSITGALQRVALGLVDQHLRHCVMQAAATSGDEAAAKLDEATRAIDACCEPEPERQRAESVHASPRAFVAQIRIARHVSARRARPRM